MCVRERTRWMFWLNTTSAFSARICPSVASNYSCLNHSSLHVHEVLPLFTGSRPSHHDGNSQCVSLHEQQHWRESSVVCTATLHALWRVETLMRAQWGYPVVQQDNRTIGPWRSSPSSTMLRQLWLKKLKFKVGSLHLRDLPSSLHIDKSLFFTSHLNTYRSDWK